MRYDGPKGMPLVKWTNDEDANHDDERGGGEGSKFEFSNSRSIFGHRSLGFLDT